MKCKFCNKTITEELKIYNPNTKKVIGNFCNFSCFKKWKLKEVVVNHNHFVEDDVAVRKKQKELKQKNE